MCQTALWSAALCRDSFKCWAQLTGAPIIIGAEIDYIDRVLGWVDMPPSEVPRGLSGQSMCPWKGSSRVSTAGRVRQKPEREAQSRGRLLLSHHQQEGEGCAIHVQFLALLCFAGLSQRAYSMPLFVVPRLRTSRIAHMILVARLDAFRLLSSCRSTGQYHPLPIAIPTQI